jgi:protease-4
MNRASYSSPGGGSEARGMLVLGGLGRSGRIAVVEVFGALGSTVRAAEFVRTFRSLEENSRVRAVVLDVDSPGGSAPAADYLHRSVARLSAKKPVVAFVRGMGASGAYLLICAATKIVAIPSAMVGSIGVISMRPLVYDMLRRWGIRVSVTKSGRLKDMWSFFREPTSEEREKEQALLDEFYERFVSSVAEARNMASETVRSAATGEVFSASKAKEIGLIDELGDLDTAIDLAMELGQVPRRVTYLRPRRGLRQRLFAQFAAVLIEELSAVVERGMRGRIDYRSLR